MNKWCRVIVCLVVFSITILPTAIAQDDDDEVIPQLVCMTPDRENNTAAIVLVDWETLEATRLDIPISGSPVWSPDHTQIAFSTFNPRGPAIHVYDMLRERLYRLTFDDNAKEYDPDWSPDGDRIVFYREYDSGMGESGLYMVDVETQDVTALVIDGTRQARPKWSPDGESIIYIQYSPKNPTPYVFDVATGEIQELELNFSQVIEVEWSPDGDRLLVHQTDGLYSQMIVLEWETHEVIWSENDATQLKHTPRWAAHEDFVLYTRQIANPEPDRPLAETVIRSLEDEDFEVVLPYYNCDW